MLFFFKNNIRKKIKVKEEDFKDREFYNTEYIIKRIKKQIDKKN